MKDAVSKGAETIKKDQVKIPEPESTTTKGKIMKGQKKELVYLKIIEADNREKYNEEKCRES